MKFMLFEDSLYPCKRLPNYEVICDKSKVIVLSQMLSSCYTSEKVKFSNGIELLKHYLYSTDIDEGIIIFIDVVPDNANTLRNYEEVITYLSKTKDKEVIVVPIPCIEYYAIKGFAPDSKDKEIIVNRLHYRDTNIAINNLSKKTATFEKFCKAAMSILVSDKYYGVVSIDEFNINICDCLLLLKQLPLFCKLEVVDADVIKADVMHIVQKQHELLIDQYVRYSKDLSYQYDIDRLNSVFYNYLDFINSFV